MPKTSLISTVDHDFTDHLSFAPKRVKPLESQIVAALIAGTLSDPFSILGPHQTADGLIIRTFLPRATRVDIIARTDDRVLGHQVHAGDGLFEGYVQDSRPYLLRIFWPHAVTITEDPYSFGPLLGDLDLHLLAEGRHFRLAACLGAHWMTIDGVNGVRFAVWAPRAQRVALVGDFNSWDVRRHPMRYRPEAGVWELFVPRLRPGARYKYAILAQDGATMPLTADPFALRTEMAPETASVVAAPLHHGWRDADWMGARQARQGRSAPVSIYEVDVRAWFPEGAKATWETAVKRLLPYVATLQFTHVLLLWAPAHPIHQGAAAQDIGSLFAPPAIFGDLEAFISFVDACHGEGIGVLVDWLPNHFFNRAADGRMAAANRPPKQDFLSTETLLHQIARPEVQGLLIASALRWLEEFHIDGLRVNALPALLQDSVGSGLGSGNYAAIDLIRNLQTAVQTRCPGAITIAAEATPWPGITAAVETGGLGFSYQWNSRFVETTYRYVTRDPIYRRWHHDEITFNLRCAYIESFLLGLSGAEAFQPDSCLIDALPGDDWQRRASLRSLLAFIWSHPGKKLLGMGSELGLRHLRDHRIDWRALDDHGDAAFIALTFTLNRLYRAEPALSEGDVRASGFEWLIIDDQENSVFAYLRRGNGASPPVAVIVNMTPIARYNYRIGVPNSNYWREILNTDSHLYGGSNVGNFGGVRTLAQPYHGRQYSIELTLPPLATLFLRSCEEAN
jgi:1,4-alpha-glucan branching enzyme